MTYETLAENEDITTLSDGDVVYKRARTAAGRRELANYAETARLFPGFAPEVLDVTRDSITVAYVPDGPVTDTEELRRNCIRLLETLRGSGVVHGDVTAPNIRVVDGTHPVLLDWGQSGTLSDCRVKQPYADAYCMMRWLADAGHDSSRRARRWAAILQDLGAHDRFDQPLLGQLLIDYGCNDGDMLALARIEGMRTIGVDINPEHAGARVIEAGSGVIRADLIDVRLDADVSLCLSTWPYVVTQHGEPAALGWLVWVVKHSGRVYFETQLAGDGPGYMHDDSDVEAMLSQIGQPERVVTIPVAGRDATRTVWRITR